MNSFRFHQVINCSWILNPQRCKSHHGGAELRSALTFAFIPPLLASPAHGLMARSAPSHSKKKNWLFIGEADAGERGAILYIIIGSCRRRGLDPYAYLRDVLTRLPRLTNRQIKDVTPAMETPVSGSEKENLSDQQSILMRIRSGFPATTTKPGESAFFH